MIANTFTPELLHKMDAYWRAAFPRKVIHDL